MAVQDNLSEEGANKTVGKSSRPTVLFIPEVGPSNPFQQMMAEYLEKNCGWKVELAPRRGALAAVRAVLRYRPQVVHFEWIEKFILGRNLAVSVIKTVHFLAQVYWIRWVLRTPIVHTVHQLSSHGGVQPNYERTINRIFTRMCASIRTYSNALKTAVIKEYGVDPSKVQVIQDVPYSRFYPKGTSKSTARRNLNIDGERFVYLAFGRVRRYKGLETLIDAFQRLNDSEDLLIVAGPVDSHDYFEELTRLAGEDSNVVFRDGFVPPEEVHLYFEAADVCVNPFRRVGHSGSVDLAMAFGKPVVTLATDAHHELLEHQRQLLFANAYELRQALQRVKHLDLPEIGRLNLELAEQSNFEDFAGFLADATR